MKYAIRPIRIAPDLWLGVQADGMWALFVDGLTPDCRWHLDRVTNYTLDFMALVLKSVESFEVAVLVRMCGLVKIEEFNDRAVQKLIDRANELWTFEVEK